MSVYRRKDSPYYWLWLERRGQPALQESSKIRIKGATPEQTKRNRQLAEDAYHQRMTELTRDAYHLPTPMDERPSIAFRRYAEWFEQHHVTKHRGAQREREILKTLTRFFSTDDLRTLTRARVSEYVTWRRDTAIRRTERKVSAGTVNREVDLLKAMLREAVPTYFEVSPLLGLKRQPVRMNDET